LAGYAGKAQINAAGSDVIANRISYPPAVMTT
jgi:hypothetical protein